MDVVFLFERFCISWSAPDGIDVGRATEHRLLNAAILIEARCRVLGFCASDSEAERTLAMRHLPTALPTLGHVGALDANCAPGPLRVAQNNGGFKQTSCD
jgi:hypothetical protein